jgi:hypothetical protein
MEVALSVVVCYAAYSSTQLAFMDTLQYPCLVATIPRTHSTYQNLTLSGPIEDDFAAYRNGKMPLSN